MGVIRARTFCFPEAGVYACNSADYPRRENLACRPERSHCLEEHPDLKRSCILGESSQNSRTSKHGLNDGHQRASQSATTFCSMGGGNANKTFEQLLMIGLRVHQACEAEMLLLNRIRVLMYSWLKRIARQKSWHRIATSVIAPATNAQTMFTLSGKSSRRAINNFNPPIPTLCTAHGHLLPPPSMRLTS